MGWLKPLYCFSLPTIFILAPLQGLDLLGIAKLDNINPKLKRPYAIGVLDHTFGSPYPNLKKLKPKAVRVHILNGTTYNHTCKNKYPWFIRGVRRLRAYKHSHPNITIYASPSLEHGCTRKGIVNRWFSKLKDFIPVCSTHRGYCPDNVLIEKHGRNARGDIASNDGVPLGKLRGTVLNLAWHPCFNGRKGYKKISILPKRRKDFCENSKVYKRLNLWNR